MNQVKLGIIGLGNTGSGHCNNILAGLTPEIRPACPKFCGRMAASFSRASRRRPSIFA